MSVEAVSIEHMFDTNSADVGRGEGVLVDETCLDETWFDEACLDETWADDEAWADGVVPPDAPAPWSQCQPSGWLALELDQGSADPAALSDADLIEGIVGFERVTSWAQARQAGLLAEFARRRPEDNWQARRSDTPSRCSEFAPDEVGLALRLSRTTASNRLAMAETLVQDLPRSHAAWQAGLIDTPKVRAIAETSCLLTGPQRDVLEARILPRAPEQTLAQLRRALLRAVLAIDPDGAERRFRERRTDRRVVVSPDGEGMSSLWALLSAPDATASYERLGQLARGLGVGGPRGMMPAVLICWPDGVTRPPVARPTATVTVTRAAVLSPTGAATAPITPNRNLTPDPAPTGRGFPPGRVSHWCRSRSRSRCSWAWTSSPVSSPDTGRSRHRWPGRSPREAPGGGY